MKTPLQGSVLVLVAIIAGLAVFKPLGSLGDRLAPGYGDVFNGLVVFALMGVSLALALIMAKRAKK